MKKHLATLIAGVLIIGPLFGLMRYLVEKEMLLKDIWKMPFILPIMMIWEFQGKNGSIR